MVVNDVRGPQDFEWVKNVRYYWDQEIDNCVVRMSNSHYIYGYEYLGASARLVITPLTVSSHAHKYVGPSEDVVQYETREFLMVAFIRASSVSVPYSPE